ncbi:MAG: transglutaminase domain-containing protein [Oscillospiraceae bacterium]|nr:transglutaminase domain-containing protein [Oscillospiraceae bacterium]
MRKRRLLPGFFCCFLLIVLSLFAGCGIRPADQPIRSPAEDETPPAAAPVPSATQPSSYTVEFWYGDSLIDSQTVAPGTLPAVPSIRALRVQGWTDEIGETVDPDAAPVTDNVKYYAVVGPVIKEDALFFFADEHGFLRPEDPFTRRDAAMAVAALVPGESDTIYPMPGEDTADEPMLRTEFLELICSLFDPETAESIMKSILPYEADTTSRAIAANVIAALLGPIHVPEGAYYPDVSPYSWGVNAILRAAGPSDLSPEALRQQSKDDCLWIDGMLYVLDEMGYFRTGEYNGLTFDGNGRFTSGDATLDRYVAETLVKYIQPDRPRLEDLRAIYYHVKSDFQYLTRNYYASGETGWENQEALTLFETGRGNCYCYAGLFRSLARGLGYNAVCYSGTMGNQNQPHAWTEITMEDGRVYICDPEIEMNYWWVAAMNNDPSLYTDNFMMPIEKSAGWNYQAVGRG